MQILLATANPSKIRELTAALTGLEFEIRTLADFPELELPAETGETFEEKRKNKSRIRRRENRTPRARRRLRNPRRRAPRRTRRPHRPLRRGRKCVGRRVARLFFAENVRRENATREIYFGARARAEISTLKVTSDPQG